MQSPTVKPANFRVNKFTLGGKEVLIAGMARPNYNDEYAVQARLKYLRDVENRTVLIGLFQNSFEVQAKAQGLEYHFIPVHDLPGKGHPISPERYDKIYEAVKKATNEGKLVTIHCGAGDGRTGTALASLKLRELLEQQASVNASTLDDVPGKTVSVHVSYGVAKNVPCTPFVKLAVEAVRQQRIVSSNADLSGSHSVETENDIDTLMNYEVHLRQMIKIELQAVVAPVVERAQAVVAPVVEQVQAAVAVPAVSLNDLMPKNVTYWDAFVAVVSVVIQCITQMVAYLFEKLVGTFQTVPQQPLAAVELNQPSYGFFSNMNKESPDLIQAPKKDNNQ